MGSPQLTKSKVHWCNSCSDNISLEFLEHDQLKSTDGLLIHAYRIWHLVLFDYNISFYILGMQANQTAWMKNAFLHSKSRRNGMITSALTIKSAFSAKEVSNRYVTDKYSFNSFTISSDNFQVANLSINVVSIIWTGVYRPASFIPLSLILKFYFVPP